ncbi:MAG: preprotein translocase subunit Sec61beta [Candidatus Helarchaeota archaeon]|nr:preprotein translocase subunit Sec61beta [Candidatus Helarchaeota archaeon]
MSKKKSKRQRRRGREGPMPFAGAGLIRFFEEESAGIKVGPIATVIVSLILIISVAVALAVVKT